MSFFGLFFDLCICDTKIEKFDEGMTKRNALPANTHSHTIASVWTEQV